ncbi:hypothetical protein ACQR2B_27165 [Bradyrhizobium oligotrophicum]|uniref:hypothetical protein n=1 Tax=Bradyrhizobium TaxID=374 RepID=UPI003EB944EA
MARILSYRPCGAEKVSLLAASEHAMFGDEFLEEHLRQQHIRVEIATYKPRLSLCRAA